LKTAPVSARRISCAKNPDFRPGQKSRSAVLAGTFNFREAFHPALKDRAIVKKFLNFLRDFFLVCGATRV